MATILGQPGSVSCSTTGVGEAQVLEPYSAALLGALTQVGIKKNGVGRTRINANRGWLHICFEKGA